MDLAWLAARVASHFFRSYFLYHWTILGVIPTGKENFDLDAHINKSLENLLFRDTKRIIEELSIHGHHTLKKRRYAKLLDYSEKATISMHQKYK